MPAKFAVVPQSNLSMTADAFLVVNQVPKIFWDESHTVYFEKAAASIPDPKDAKKPKDAPPVEENDDPPMPVPHFHESGLLEDKKYSDDKDKIRCLPDIIDSMGDHVYYNQKSNLCIFRFEDVMFTVFPQLASLKRKFNTSKEIFMKCDPFMSKSVGQIGIGSAPDSMQQAQQGLIQSENSMSKSNMEPNLGSMPVGIDI
jgi:hypothetical protein